MNDEEEHEQSKEDKSPYKTYVGSI